MQPLLSIIVPVYNERENLALLFARIQETAGPASSGAFEVILVDDGSSDGSSALLDELHKRDQRYKVIHFSRNFGHQPALQAGLDAASGHVAVLMDADLQDPPELIEQLMDKWKQGYEVVYAIRKNRREQLWKRIAYSMFYRSLRAFANFDIPLNAGDFCLLDRHVVQTLVALRERNRFLRGLRAWVGFRQIGIEYDRQERNAGVPKYTLRKLFRLALSGYVGFTLLPLRAAAWLGFTSAAAGFLLLLWIVISRFTNADIPQGWASLAALILFIGGLQLVMLGIIGEYLGRTYDEVRQRPLYVVRSRAGAFEAKPNLSP